MYFDYTHLAYGKQMAHQRQRPQELCAPGGCVPALPHHAAHTSATAAHKNMRPRRRAGPTANGGANSYGTMFSMSAAGALDHAPHSFDSKGGAYPIAALAQGMGGNFYGSTSTGGSGGLAPVQPVRRPGPVAWPSSLTGRQHTRTYSDDTFVGRNPGGRIPVKVLNREL